MRLFYAILTSSYHIDADYTVDIRNSLELGLHIGYHESDFNAAFNGVPGTYCDYSVSLFKDGFSFMITYTGLDDADPDGLDNDEIKFVVGCSIVFELQV